MTREERDKIENELRDLEFDIAMEADCWMVGAMEHRKAELEKLLEEDDRRGNRQS